MESVKKMKISAGIRIGYWKPGFYKRNEPFNCIGFYDGPDVGDHIPGQRLKWPLIDGDLILSVGVLFRPDLGKRQALETILIVQKYQEEMWDYDDFKKSLTDQKSLS